MAKLKTTETFKDDVKRLVGEDYVVLSPYIGSRQKITLQHVSCGRIW